MNILKSAAVSALALTAAAVLAPSASATLVVSSGVGAAPLGVNYVNFDNLPLGAAGGVSGGIGVSFVPDGKALTGAISGIAAAPFLSNNNGVPFGNSNNGADTTTYLSTGIGSVTMSFASSQTYLGLLWGSVDSYNTLSFYNGATLVGQVTGTQVTAGANGDQGVNGTYYVNIGSSLAFNKVVATSTQYAFEFDNVSYNSTIPNDITPVVPEPATLTLLGLGVSAFGMIRRKKLSA